ncbi:MAG TPA: hypothetical protein VF454_07615, partial [Gemmatimonadales bacterium]
MAVSLFASPVWAQVSEMQIGGIASFGPGRMDEPNGGTVFGVSAGRLVYIGGRVTRYGESRRTPDSTITVTDQATALAVDLAIIVPAGPLEV